MTSFTATLTISGVQDIAINAFTMDMHQSADTLGRPASPVSGGQLSITFNTTNNPTITGWMINPSQQRNGTVRFYDLVGRTMKVIEFTNAYCIDMEENFEGTDDWMQMETTIVVSPETITVGYIPHDNNWPQTEAIHL